MLPQAAGAEVVERDDRDDRRASSSSTEVRADEACAAGDQNASVAWRSVIAAPAGRSQLLPRWGPTPQPARAPPTVSGKVRQRAQRVWAPRAAR